MVKLYQHLTNVKKVTQICNLKRDQFLKEFIWNNYLFKYDSKPLCFENWIKSGILYTKDMFDNNGNFYNIEHFYNILERKNNILCEYIMIKKALKEYRNKFDCSFASSVDIKQDILFLFSDNSIKYPKNINSKFYYSILVNKKFQRSIYEHKWQKTFELSEKTVWRNIYISKIKYMYEKMLLNSTTNY